MAKLWNKHIATTFKLIDTKHKFSNCGIQAKLDWTRGRGNNPSTASMLSCPLVDQQGVSQCPHHPLEIERSDKTWQDFKVGIFNEDKRTQKTQTRVEATQRAGGWLDFFSIFLFQLYLMFSHNKLFWCSKTLCVYLWQLVNQVINIAGYNMFTSDKNTWMFHVLALAQHQCLCSHPQGFTVSTSPMAILLVDVSINILASVLPFGK